MSVASLTFICDSLLICQDPMGPSRENGKLQSCSKAPVKNVESPHFMKRTRLLGNFFWLGDEALFHFSTSLPHSPKKIKARL